MKDLHFPWIELSILIPLIGAAVLSRVRDSYAARQWCVFITGLSLLSTVAEWQDFGLIHAKEAEDTWHFMSLIFKDELFLLDQLNAPLLPCVALLYFLTTFTTLKTKIRRFSFAWMLVGEAAALGTLSVNPHRPWILVVFLVLGCIPPFFEIQSRGRCSRVYMIFMGLFAILLIVGQAMMSLGGPFATIGVAALAIAVLVRSGTFPFHLWMPDLFEKATFGTSLLFCTPLFGALTLVRLLYPTASHNVLSIIGVLSTFTAVYAAGMSLVQTDARRFFCFLLLSHASLVMAGLDLDAPIAVTGALSLWIATALSLCGFGLTLRALEARRGRLKLDTFHGLYGHTPALAVCFFLTGVASVGFPGTTGFVGGELLVDAAVTERPYFGALVVLAATINGISVVRAYFRLFTGTVHESSVSLALGRREQVAVLSLAALVVLGGIWPQAGVTSRYHAAVELLKQRENLHLLVPAASEHAATEHQEEQPAEDSR